MSNEYARKWAKKIASSISGEMYGVNDIVVICKDDIFPDINHGVKQIISSMKLLCSYELSIDAGDQKALVISHEYDDVHVYINCRRTANIRAISRTVRLLFSQPPDIDNVSEKCIIPASVAEKNIKKWERQVSMIFGSNFASKLMATSLKNMNINAMTKKELENIRTFMSSYIGGCLDLKLSY
ncbi:hypothetical protein CUJ83_07320 [Methanocella sp. CWC-04]|uniref:Uncharacterized protein n=1 Tax=Methanooceanicella nereidis TaxID=2052831 RepID=A0AAP2W626_9EURY|nr:hypothetical protein [Methanocella sp. CWC-04]